MSFFALARSTRCSRSAKGAAVFGGHGVRPALRTKPLRKHPVSGGVAGGGIGALRGYFTSSSVPGKGGAFAVARSRQRDLHWRLLFANPNFRRTRSYYEYYYPMNYLPKEPTPRCDGNSKQEPTAGISIADEQGNYQEQFKERLMNWNKPKEVRRRQWKEYVCITSETSLIQQYHCIASAIRRVQQVFDSVEQVCNK